MVKVVLRSACFCHNVNAKMQIIKRNRAIYPCQQFFCNYITLMKNKRTIGSNNVFSSRYLIASSREIS